MQLLRLPASIISRIKIIAVIIPVTFFYSCRESIPEQKEPLVERTPLNVAIIADTVIYDVVVKNPEPDDLWRDECLRNLNRKGLVDVIFNAIYRKELIPYDFFSNKPLSVNDITDIENAPGFSRENIGSIQFSEEWYFDEDNLRMEKRVNSMSLGYEVFDSSGNLRGYKPAFMVKLN